MSEAATHGAFDPVAYIQHHLTNACVGCDPATDTPAALADFTVFFLVTFLVSFALARVFMLIAWKVGRNLKLERPGGLQNVIEVVVESAMDWLVTRLTVTPEAVTPSAMALR